MDRERFEAETLSLGLRLSSSQFDAFSKFEDALYVANEQVNLTRVSRDEAWVRHFLDSLLVQDLIPPASKVLDIGAGPGFPSWPLACARPDLRVTALDSNGKMLGFLRSHPLPNLQVAQVRAEDWGVRDRFDFVTGRALAPLSIQLELSAAPCCIGGTVAPMRSSADERAAKDFPCAELGLELVGLEKRTLAILGAERLFPVYRKVRPTPRTYPRRWAEMKAKPL